MHFNVSCRSKRSVFIVGDWPGNFPPRKRILMHAFCFTMNDENAAEVESFEFHFYLVVVPKGEKWNFRFFFINSWNWVRGIYCEFFVKMHSSRSVPGDATAKCIAFFSFTSFYDFHKWFYDFCWVRVRCFCAIEWSHRWTKFSASHFLWQRTATATNND